ncbi:MAG TPA: SBBP repeat-containing protein, partial [Chitinophagaceae bacterium]
MFLSAYGQAPIQFIENKGQWDKSVQFMGEVPAGAFFVQKSGYTVVQQNHDDLRELHDKMHGHAYAHGHEKNDVKDNQRGRIRSHAYEVKLLGSNPNPEVIADKTLAGYSNYFLGNDPSKWASECRTFQGITMKDVYPNIDVRYYSNNGQLKYDFIVKPGGDVSRIALKYTGADKLEVKNKELVIKTSVGEVKELYPYSYQNRADGKSEVAAKYVVKGNVVSFDIKGHDKKNVLVIDPTPIFASFAGSSAPNWGFTATPGPNGEMFGGGISNATGFPVNVGAYDQTYNGGEWDIVIIKLTADGTNRLYATYLGGSGVDQPHSLIADAQGNLVVAGRTNSGDTYPTLPAGSGGVIGTGGQYDIVITKLNAAGSALIGSKRIGGSSNDGVNISPTRTRNSLQYNYGDDGRSEVIVDGAGNIYLASSTQSSGFPTTPGSFGTTFGGGLQDGVVLKLSPD